MNELKVTGTITKVLNPESGTSQAGKEWRKQDFVITTGGNYPKENCFTLFGDKIDLISNLKLNDEVEVSFNFESREYNGKYFHNINAWKVILTQPEAPKSDAEENPANDTAAEHNKQFDEPTDVSGNEGTNDLPF